MFGLFVFACLFLWVFVCCISDLCVVSCFVVVGFCVLFFVLFCVLLCFMSDLFFVSGGRTADGRSNKSLRALPSRTRYENYIILYHIILYHIILYYILYYYIILNYIIVC